MRLTVSMIKKTLILVIFASLSFSLSAQNKFHKKKVNQPNFEKHTFHFGFSLGTNKSSFRTKYDLTAIDSLTSIQVAKQTGFNIGFVGSMRFNNFFTLRFLPTLAFAQRDVDFIFKNTDRNITNSRIIESTYVMFPLLIKYRSLRYNNFAAYVVAGGNYAHDLSSKIDVDNNLVIDAQVLKVKKDNFFAEIGFGTDFFLEYFKFGIEFKYSHGLNNILYKDDSFWAKPIQEIKPGMFTISLLFEG